MLYLVALPEIAYLRQGSDIINTWTPGKNLFFKFQVLEFPNGTRNDIIESKLLVSETLVPLTKEEIAHYKKKYKH